MCISYYNLTLTSVVFEYINMYIIVISILDLTLTSVVFESMLCKYYRRKHENLTLTSVVFELEKKAKIDGRSVKFNFNKCCI